MKLLCAFVLACVGTALGQVQLPCPFRSFKADTFDAINFAVSYSYHDSPNGLTYYVNADDEGSHLMDFNTGTVYVQPDNGDCYKVQNDGLKLNVDPLAVLQNLEQEFQHTGTDGVTRTGLQVQQGDILVRNVFADQPTCDPVFFSISYNGNLYAARAYQNHIELTDDDVNTVKDALAAFKAADCPLSDQFL